MSSPIPDDWDGQTLRCYRVWFPDSEKYRSVLLGQITEPDDPEFWDEADGDTDVPARAIFQSSLLTLADFDTMECGEMIPIPYFRAETDSNDLSVIANIWKTVPFNILAENENSPQFLTSEFSHQPQAAANLGLWLYVVNVGIDIDDHAIISLWYADNSISIFNAKMQDRLAIAVPYHWDAPAQVGLHVRILSPFNTNIRIEPRFTSFSGMLIGKP